MIRTGIVLPFHTSEKLEEYGLHTKIVTAVTKEMGMNPVYSFFPWKRCEINVRKGKVFGTFPYAKTEERIEKFDFTDNLLYTSCVFFYYKPSMKKISYRKFEDLKKYKIAGARGYNYLLFFKKAGLKVQVVNSRKQLVHLIKRNRVQLAPMDKVGGWLEIKKLFPSEIENFGTLDRPVEDSPEKSSTHIMVSRAYPDYKELIINFNKALKSIKSKGIYGDIMEEYNLPRVDKFK